MTTVFEKYIYYKKVHFLKIEKSGKEREE